MNGKGNHILVNQSLAVVDDPPCGHSYGHNLSLNSTTA